MLRLALVLAAVAAPLAAADLDVAVKPVYFQTIKLRAFVDGRGAVWFLDKTNVHDAAGKKVAVRPSDKHDLILADKAGRFWFWNPYDPAKTGLVYSVGDDVTVTKLAAPARTSRGSSTIAIHEDSAGRVFVRTPKAVHVLLADGKWDNLPLFEVGSTGFTVFVEDPKGRTWMSVAQHLPKVQGGAEGTVGAWCFDGKVWKNHTPADGFPFEQVEFVLPFADDWFLVVEHVDDVRNAPKPSSKLWSPSRTAKEIADTTAFADLPMFAIKYLGTDLDGNRYLSRPYAAHDGAKLHEATLVRVSPQGKITLLEGFGLVKKGKAMASDSILKQPQVMTDPLLPILARPGDLRMLYPETGNYDCLGRDMDGRIWFKVHYGHLGSHCLWPAKEKDGDLLRLEPHGGNARGMLLAGGEAWTAFETVTRWDGKKWVDDDPFPAFKRAQWVNRGGPPANYYIANFRSQSATPTGDGGLIAWRVTTKYEGTASERFAPKEEEPKKVDPKAPTFVFRLALRADHRWGKPDEPLAVLKAKARDLVKAMATDRAEPAAVAVAGDGARLWVAFDGKLHAIEANGDTTTVELAKPPEPTAGAGGYQQDQLLPMLLTTTVLPLGENRALVATSAGSWVATFRTTKVRDIKLEKLAGGVPKNLFRDNTGAVWGWSSLEELLKFDGEKFTPLKAARGPMAFTDDGVLWCYAPLTIKLPPGNKRPVSLVRVCGDSIEPFTWKADEIEVGFTKPPKGSAVVWPSEHGLLCVEAQAKPGERPVLRKRAYSESMGGSGVGPPFVVTGTGEILFGSHWGKLFE